jgi:hypothetical protein
VTWRGVAPPLPAASKSHMAALFIATVCGCVLLFAVAQVPLRLAICDLACVLVNGSAGIWTILVQVEYATNLNMIFRFIYVIWSVVTIIALHPAHVA